MRNAVQLCLAANNILLMRKGNRAFLLLAIALACEMADRFASQGYSLKKQTQWSNDETIIELGRIANDRDSSVSRISIICSPQTNRDILLNLVQ